MHDGGAYFQCHDAIPPGCNFVMEAGEPTHIVAVGQSASALRDALGARFDGSGLRCGTRQGQNTAGSGNWPPAPRSKIPPHPR
jgi:hypothetical protein